MKLVIIYKNMFRDYVKTLTLDRANIQFYIKYEDNEQWLPVNMGDINIEDIAEELPEIPGVLNCPDYVIHGELRIINKGQLIEFYIAKQNGKGSSLLYITGVPKKGDKDSFRLKEAIWVSYWEDIKYGYLFQVLNV